jgi:NarL family two-component system response regulator LiaR
MDLVMPRQDGPAAIAAILDQDPDAKIIALTSFADDHLVQRAIAAGAIGYLLKNASPDQLASAIRSAHAGQPTIDAQAAQALMRSAASDRRPTHGLTKRELDVLALLVEGKTNKEIAEELFLSASTIRDYVSQILDKLDVSNRTEAAAMAIQENLIP